MAFTFATKGKTYIDFENRLRLQLNIEQLNFAGSSSEDHFRQSLNKENHNRKGSLGTRSQLAEILTISLLRLLFCFCFD